MPETFESGLKIRCHLSSILSKAIKCTWFILALLVANCVSIFKKMQETGIQPVYAWIFVGLTALFFIVVFVWFFIRWRKTYIYFEGHDFIVERNFFFSRSKITLRPESIASINLLQGILERIFKTYRLQFDINSSATADSTDFDLVFDKKTALEIKSILERRRFEQPLEATMENSTDIFQADSSQTSDTSCNPAFAATNVQADQQNALAGANVQNSGIIAAAARSNAAEQQISLQTTHAKTGNSEQELTVIRRFSFREVSRHAILGAPLWSLIYSIVSIPLMFWLLLDDSVTESSITDPSNIIAIIIAVWPIIVQIISPFFRYYGFTLAKKGNEVIISCGLITQHQFILPLEKTNAIVISQPFLARLSGLSCGYIINIGMGDINMQIEPFFSLLTTRDELDSVLSKIAPQFVVNSSAEGSPKSALPVIALRYSLVCLLLLFLVLFPLSWWKGALLIDLLSKYAWAAVLIILLLAVLLAISSRASWKTKALCLENDKLAVTSGIFSKRTIVTFYSKLQDLHWHNGPISGKSGLAHGSMTILASSVWQNNSIGFFNVSQFETIAQEMIKHEDAYRK